MGAVVIRRPPRRPAPEIPTGDLAVQAPPEIPRSAGSRWQQAFQLLPMLTGTIATALLFAGRDGGAYSYVIGGIFGISTLGMLATSWGGAGVPRRSEMIAARRDYLRHLAALRRQVRRTVARQRAGLYYRHPDPERLWSIPDSYRLWERRPTDEDFAVVRVAVGPQTLATPLVAPETGPLDELEPLTAGALRRFLGAYSTLPELPVAVSLRGFARVFVRGEDPAGAPVRGPVRGLTRAIIAQLVVFHAPDDLLIAVCAAPERRAEWDWVKWLPHALHPVDTDALGPQRLVASGLAELEGRLGGLLAGRARVNPGATGSVAPHIVVILDGGERTGTQHLATGVGVAGVTLLDLDAPPPRLPDRSTIVLEIAADGRLSSSTADGAADAGDAGDAGEGGVTGAGAAGRRDGTPGEIGVADSLSRPEIEALARRLTPLRLAARVTGADTPLAGEPGLAELLEIGDPHALEAAEAWVPREHRNRLRVPIGASPDGSVVELDLKESAQDGMGPHGLLIGATGSGKSELLRTLVLALATTHSSETLNFVLVDFKGGATFVSLDRLPHVAAVITNLADELPLVDRMTDAVNGELVRRQELLRRAGNFASVRDYERARAGGAALAPLPSLLIICDEFSELLTAKPDFIDLFVQIGRVGRSLGVHLLLASQRLEEGRLRGLDTHLSYRIGLRTFSALESRTVLGVPDAFELPRAPGHGYLKYGTEPMIRFKAAYVSGGYSRPERPAVLDAAAPGHRVLDYGTHLVPVPVPAPGRPATEATEATEAAWATREAGDASLLDIIVGRLAGRGVPAHQVWLPPLSDSPGLDELLGPLGTDQARGFGVANPQLRGTLQVPVALVDKPYEQRREVLWLRLDSAAGHVAVIGGPQSGKSTALRSIITALALTHTPAEAQVYCLDFGGGQLAGVRGLPHVGAVAGRLDVAAVRRTVGEVATLLAERERRFADGGVDGMAGYRRQRATVDGAEADDPWGDVFLVVDGWGTLRGEFDDLEPVITDLATRGLSYGIHVMATASRWTDFRPALRDLFGSRLELRLGDPSDSLVSRKAAANVPERTPGRGITTGGLHLLTARPRLSSAEATESVRTIAAGWSGPVAAPVRLLPTSVPFSAIEDDHAQPADSGRGAGPLVLPIGIAESDLRPARVNFAAEPHFLLFGDAECGKSTFLRTVARTITSRFPPEQARIILVDYRRSLLDSVRSEHLIGYGTAAAQTEDLVASVAGYMRRRLPGPDLTAEQLRTRSWWTGPECFVLVDDYDLVATGPANPLLPLLEYLSQARDLGLHVILTRRSGGASRALFEPLIQRLRELSSPGLVMSGDREEGALLGNVRPASMPPGRGWLVTRRGGARLVQVPLPF